MEIYTVDNSNDLYVRAGINNLKVMIQRLEQRVRVLEADIARLTDDNK